MIRQSKGFTLIELMIVVVIIGVIAAALTMPVLLMVLNKAYTIGSVELPAPQAGLYKETLDQLEERALIRRREFESGL